MYIFFGLFFVFQEDLTWWSICISCANDAMEKEKQRQDNWWNANVVVQIYPWFKSNLPIVFGYGKMIMTLKQWK